MTFEEGLCVVLVSTLNLLKDKLSAVKIERSDGKWQTSTQAYDPIAHMEARSRDRYRKVGFEG